MQSKLNWDHTQQADLSLVTALVVGGTTEERRALNLCLGAQGFECHEAADGIDALRFCGDLGIDLIIVDERMRFMEAAEFLSLVQRGAFGVNPPPVVGWLGDEASAAETRHDTYAGHLRGPVTSAKLEAVLAAIFQDRG